MSINWMSSLERVFIEHRLLLELSIFTRTLFKVIYYVRIFYGTSLSELYNC